ncbi:MAG: DNA polymerase IV [Syntrophales bacterium]
MSCPPIRKILHLDLDAFFCSVEEQRNPKLRGKPFAVGGSPDSRGVVASCSYAARRFGIRSAMPTARALRLCPELIIISPKHGTYGEISRKVMSRICEVADLVEQISIDEAFLDVTMRPELAEQLARELQAHIMRELGLPSSLGVATNKLVAKIATDIGKAEVQSDRPPNAIKVVLPGTEAAFLSPLPVQALWGVGPKTASRLADMGIHTIGDIAVWPAQDMEQRFGKHGRDLFRRARGIDDSPVAPRQETKSISREHTFARDVHDPEQLHRALANMSSSIARRMRRSHLSASTVKLKVRWPDFTTLSRQVTLSQPTDLEANILEAAEVLFRRIWQTGRPVRLLGVGVSVMGPPVRQLTLWEAAPDESKITALEKEQRLEAALETLRSRFGDTVVWWGSETDSEET